jgi:hypothetical protein
MSFLFFPTATIVVGAAGIGRDELLPLPHSGREFMSNSMKFPKIDI